ncbi:hypothetical protein GCM10009670_12340 [Citricoccus alkalitolerans]
MPGRGTAYGPASFRQANAACVTVLARKRIDKGNVHTEISVAIYIKKAPRGSIPT